MFLESIFPLTIRNMKKDIFFTILRQAVLRCFSDADSLISPASGPAGSGKERRLRIG